ncbi:MAG: YihY/virulence factor BrkB family protein [Bacteroidota bacterium]
MEKQRFIRNISFKEMYDLLKETFVAFFKERTFLHSAALSYYTVFTLVPILYLSIVTFGKIIGQKTMVEIITEFLRDNIGIRDVSGIIDYLNQVNFEKTNVYMQVVGVVTLLISSSALFTSLQYSINEFFDIEKKYESRKKMIYAHLGSRLTSIILLAFLGLIVIATYFFQTILISFGNHLFADLGTVEWALMTVVQHSLAIISNILIFWLIFKYLHHAIVPWKLALAGSVFTSVLLYIGQLLIKYYLTNYFFARDTGIAGSILVILVWMYYTSQIIFLGAKFIAVYAIKTGKPLQIG